MPGPRDVFKFHDGTGDAHADPLAVYRRFVAALDGDPDPVLEAARNDGADPGALLARLDAQGKLAAASRAAFGLPGVDRATGQGVTDGAALETLYDFLRWLEGNGRGAASGAT